MSNGDSWPSNAGNAPWPTPYRAATDLSTNSEPRLQRGAILALAPMVTGWFLADDQSFGRSYCDIVRLFRDGDTTDHSGEFLDLLRKQFSATNWLSDNPLTVANEHDFANLHRSVWLRVYQAIVRVLNFNIHGDWGDPPGGMSSQGRYDEPPPDTLLSFHTTPNGVGSFAVSTQDVPAPDLGIGEPSGNRDKATPDIPLDVPSVRTIAHKLGQALVDPANGGRYHGIVKNYYRDRGHHTPEYAKLIGQIVGDGDTKLDSLAKIGDNDFANIHRGVWLFLAHRFSFVVGENPFGTYGEVDPTKTTRFVLLPTILKKTVTFEVPNDSGGFNVNLSDIDPDADAGDT